MASIIEVHYCLRLKPQCDGPQALLPETFFELMGQLRKIAAIFGKEFARVAAQESRPARHRQFKLKGFGGIIRPVTAGRFDFRLPTVNRQNNL